MGGVLLGRWGWGEMLRVRPCPVGASFGQAEERMEGGRVLLVLLCLLLCEEGRACAGGHLRVPAWRQPRGCPAEGFLSPYLSLALKSSHVRWLSTPLPSSCLSASG